MVTDYQIIKPGNVIVAPFGIKVEELDEPRPVKYSSNSQQSIDTLISGSKLYKIPMPQINKRFFGGSTVTFVTDGKKKVIVDTGFENSKDQTDYNRECNERILRGYLRMHRLDFDDIDLVFITHAHIDHAYNIYPFMSAGADIVLPEHVKEGDEIISGLTVIDTPGHTTDHKSLVFRLSLKDFVIAGDAVINNAYYVMDHVFYSNQYDDEQIEQAKRSMQKIQMLADFIIPGHGTVFINEKK